MNIQDLIEIAFIASFQRTSEDGHGDSWGLGGDGFGNGLGYGDGVGSGCGNGVGYGYGL